MQSSAKTVEEYIASLPPERQAVMNTIRDVILKNLPKGYEEGMTYGMIGYYIPLSRYSNTYNGQPIGPVALAAQKHYYSLYLMTVYGDRDIEKWFTEEFAKSGKKLDMGKSCLRFKKLEDIPLDLIAKTVALAGPEEMIKKYENAKKIS